MNAKLKSFIIQVLRRASYKWEPRTNAKMRNRVLAKNHPEINAGRSRYLYPCEICGKLCKDTKKGEAKEFHMDHIEPVEPINGFDSGVEFDLNEHVERLFCEEDGFQRICVECHLKKSNEENELRRKYKKSKKSLDK